MVNVPGDNPAVQGGSALSGLLANMNAAGGAGSGSAFVQQNEAEPTVRLRRPSTPTARPGGNKPLDTGGRLPRTMPSGPSWADVPLSKAENDIYTWDLKEQRAFARRMWVLGYPDVASPDDLGGAFKVWGMAVKESAKYGLGGKPMDPRDVLELFAGANSEEVLKRTRAAESQAGVRTTKARGVDLSNPSQAKAMITEAFLTSMGREPTSAEVRTLTRTLNAQQSANPVNQTTQTTTDALGNVTNTSSTQSGGLDANQYISEKAKADPEAAAYQGATTYFNALMETLRSPV